MMTLKQYFLCGAILPGVVGVAFLLSGPPSTGVMVNRALAHDVSPPLGPPGVEQTQQGAKASPAIVVSFDGLGFGFEGPQGTVPLRNPSDNSLAVGPDHIVQTVNSKMAIFTKKGKKYDVTGKILYGPVNTGNVFKDFGAFGDLNGGDAVVRYDQLADRWLVVLPIFPRLPFKKNVSPGFAAVLSPPTELVRSRRRLSATHSIEETSGSLQGVDG